MEFELTKNNADYSVQVLPPNKMGQPSPTLPRPFLITQLLLRALVLALSFSAVLVAVTAHQSTSVMSFVFQASFKDSSAMRFQVGANAVVCFSSFVSLILFYGFRRPKFDPGRNCFQFIVYDLVITILLISGCAAGSAVGYIAKHGQKQGGWPALCKYVDKFCDKVAFSLVLSYIAFFCTFVLTVMGAYHLRSLTMHTINAGGL